MTNTDSPEQTLTSDRSLAVHKSQMILTGERGLKLTNYEEMYRFAKAVAQSKFKPVPDWNEIDCFICLQKGAEVGMSPMQSLESIYVVNNRATLFGDAPKALIEASGLMADYDQYEEGKAFDDDFKYVVMSHRKGRNKPIITAYSVADAKLAKLWGKAGAWTTAPKRMLMFRARGFNLRDNFSDVLKGFTIGELLDEESVVGFENAKTASAKIVEPNFQKPELATVSAGSPESGQTISSEGQLPRRRGRPPKNPNAQTELPKPAEPEKEEQKPEPEPTPKPEPEPAPVTATKAPSESLFPKQVEIIITPALEVIRRLKEAKVSETKFLELMREYGFAECDLGDITMGDFTIGKMDKQDLEVALKNWPQILKNLTEEQNDRSASKSG